VPPDLVSTAQAGISGGGKVRVVMIDDLRAMTEAAAAAGNAIGVESAYRSYESQEKVFDGWVSQFGYERALEVSARPGHSEHQLGLAIDFRSEPGGSSLNGTWGTSPAGAWMKAHAWEYGFVMSYPKGTMALTCYSYEPWHFRYVGRPLAALIHASGLTPREYLWAHFTTTIVPPAPLPSRSPAKSAVPTASPAATPLPTPAATPEPTPTVPPPTPIAEPTGAVATPAPIATSPGEGHLLDGSAPDPSVLMVVGFAGVIALGAGLLRRRRAE
jgi:D-alanyl-D-alanine carboxypeptidase